MVEGRLGSPPLAAKRDQFARLIARGIGNAEACRIAGVHPKTGKRWRRGRVMITSGGKTLHYAPVIDTRRQVISQRYLSQDDRVHIADLAAGGLGVRADRGTAGTQPVDSQPGAAP
jgi:IS30 family transposase